MTAPPSPYFMNACVPPPLLPVSSFSRSLTTGRVRAPANAPGDGELRARGRPTGVLGESNRLAVLQAGREVVRPGDEHNASMGGFVLVLPSVHRHQVSHRG